uniref:Variant surface glycoprotein 1125.5194 n=1 Tax=Trypanosoma brucei TaxID=5691 RepID=A0A1J0RCB3_9TRYP|nr:variant surface glycoprotein 1125.5194 [Trypanosoma brucei]
MSLAKGSSRLLVIGMLLVFNSPKGADATMAAGSNRGEHAALCDFVALAEAGADFVAPSTNDEATYKYIQRINFTVAPTEWQAKFYSDKGRKIVHKGADSACFAASGAEIYWKDWADATVELAKADNQPEFKDSGVKELSENQKAAARNTISEPAQRAKEVKEHFSKASTGAEGLTEPKANAVLKLAAYGDVTKGPTNVDEPKVFKATTGSDSRSSVCEAATEEKKVVTIAVALTCLCLKPTGGAGTAVTDGACTNKADGTNGWEAGTSAAESTDTQQILQTCPLYKSTKASAAAIRQALARLRNLIHVDAGPDYLGAYLGTVCSGSNDRGFSVRLANYGTNGDEAFNKLRCVNLLK